MLALLAELMNLKTTTRGGRVVAERPAITRPLIPIVFAANSGGLHNHPVTEALEDLTIGDNVINGPCAADKNPQTATHIRK